MIELNLLSALNNEQLHQDRILIEQQRNKGKI